MANIITQVGNYPYIKVDVNGREIQDSSDDVAFRGDYDGGENLIYQGFARPGASEAGAVWQVSKNAYDGNNNITSKTWPQNANAHASSDYSFVWADRASYTYS